MKILIVDDEPAVLKMMVLILTGRGHEVITATDVAMALGLVETEEVQFDLIISDITMPGANGFELANSISQLPAPIPVILMSGYSAAEGTLFNSSRSTETPFIAKPFMPKDLLAKISQVMEEHRGDAVASRNIELA